MTPTPRNRRLPARDTMLMAAAATVGIAGLAAAGCSSSDKANGSSVASTVSSTTPTTAKPATNVAPTTAAGPTAPGAPAGAQQLQTAATNGATYWRYSIAGASPAQVVGDYRSELQSAGYTVTDQGGGGGGWGKWGGAGAGLTGQHGGTFISVQAGGQTGAPTYFEVCVGPNSTSVQDCENVSDGPNQDQGDSNSGAS
jgi:hypothetical protein